MMLSALAWQVDRSRALAEAFLTNHSCVYISSSFGKDSVVLLWLLRDVAARVPVVWFDGGKFDEYPETADFARAVCDQWDYRLTVVHPEVPLLEQWRRYGIPTGRGELADRVYTREFVGALRREAQRAGYEGALLGMRGDESIARRRYVFARRGPVYFVSGEQQWRCCPLYAWTTADIWALIDSEGLPLHPVYTRRGDPRPRQQRRLGVLAESCFEWNGAFAEMRRYYPHLWNELRREFPAVGMFGS